jgi:uncharacterized membrane protein YedE/YeeE
MGDWPWKETVVMNEAKTANGWATYTGVSLIALIAITALAVATHLWVLTAIPIGFLFGFFLQKGDLCGASAFSEVLIMKDWRKVFGVWVVIAAGMVGFAVLDWLGWVQLAPKPLLWVNYLIGGLVFGVGTVLAGGCVSGCLFKAGTGNLNSMVGLLGIFLGVAVVEYGPLSAAYQSATKTFVVKAADGGPVTLSSVLGVPFGLLAVVIALVTLVVAVVRGKRGKGGGQSERQPFSFARAMTAAHWKPWQAGLLIGLLNAPAYLSSAATGRNYPLGVTHGVLHSGLLLTDGNLKHGYQKPPAPPPPAAAQPAPLPPGAVPQKKVSWWLILVVIFVVAGAWVAGKMSGQAKLLPKPPDQTVIAFFGGLLVGAGAAFGTGCVIGNIMSGWALMSVGMILFGVMTVVGNWIATYFYLMGGGLSFDR